MCYGAVSVPQVLHFRMSLMIILRSAVLVLIAGVFLLQPPHAKAQESPQGLKRAPADFEECAESAEKSTTGDERIAELAKCHAKFAGRRKPGGGYTYYDFLQDRSFDIAGPNPTPEEQKKISESYAAFLAGSRHEEATAEPQQRETIQQSSLPAEVDRRPARTKQQKAGRRRSQQDICVDAFTCGMSRLTKFKEFLFGSPPGKGKRG